MQNDLLPIDLVLPELVRTLEESLTVILQAEPGAGKTTRVPLALMGQNYINGKILLLEPRRIAARAAAKFMAQTLNERVGERIGYSMRMERRVTQATQVEVITEGLLVRRLLQDPELTGVSLVIFDEFHERSIHTDLGLALCREVAALRDTPLRLLVMSATLDTEQLSRQLDNAPVISSPGRSFPIEIKRSAAAISRHELFSELQRRCRSALAIDGDVLVFLPGRAEINQLSRQLSELWHDRTDIEVIPLYSGVSDSILKQLFDTPQAGVKRFILATSIAQTSVTLPSVTCVIDSGLERRPKYNPKLGISRLATERISAATATQRAGRAGRVQAGSCFQLWSDEQHRQLRDHDRPQICDIDLSDTALLLLNWGVHQLHDLEWIEPPTETLWRAAQELLHSLGAISRQSNRPVLTDLGRRMSKIPTEPRIARLLLAAEELQSVQLGAQIAALLSDPPKGRESDLKRLLESSFKTEPRNKQMQRLSERLMQLVSHDRSNPDADSDPGKVDIAALLLPAFADRIAQRTDQANGRYRLGNGTALRLDPVDPLCRFEYLICLDIGGREESADLRLSLACPTSVQQIHAQLQSQIRQEQQLRWEGETLRAVGVELLGKLELVRKESSAVSDEALSQAWCDRLKRDGLTLLPHWQKLNPWLARLRYLQTHQDCATEALDLPALTDTALLEQIECWLGPSLRGVYRVTDLAKIDLKTQLLTLLPWQITQWLEHYTPASYITPSGRKLAIDYQGELPSISVKLQEMFGCKTTPTTGLGLPIRVELLSPAGRPLAMTTDLSHFWLHTYAEVRKENRGRYSKHPWPEDPLSAEATQLTNAAIRRRNAE